MHKRFKKIIKRTFLVVILLGFICIHFLVPRILTEKRNSLTEALRGKKDTVNYFKTIDTSKYKQKKLSIPSYDGLALSSLLTYTNAHSVKGTIILVHSSGSTKYSFLELSDLLARNGFNAIAIDLRAFGESEGRYSTYGVKEKKDIQSIINYLIKHEKLNTFGIWGKSLGGAVALQAMALDKRIEFGIIESAFTDFKTNMDTYFTRVTGLELKPFTNYVTNRAGTIGDFDADDASPIRYCERITQPILVVHGTNDIVFKLKYGKANFDKIPSKKKAFIKIDNAGHTNIWNVGGETYFNSVLEFMNNATVN